MRSIRLFTAVVIATCGLAAVGVTTEAANATDSRELTVAYTRVMKNEKFAAWGTLSTPVARTVKLQYRYHSDDPWTTLNTLTSNSGGQFSFYPITTTKTRYWRYYAPATAGHASIKGYSKKIYAVNQSVKYFAVTPDYQCSLYSNDVVMVAQFYPARRYRQVAFQTNTGVKYASQDGNGMAAVVFNPGTSTFSYQATATVAAFDGVAALTSTTRTYRQDQQPCL